jgi:hypothetical protein
MGASFFLRRRARSLIRFAVGTRSARDAHVKLKSRLPQPAARVQ